MPSATSLISAVISASVLPFPSSSPTKRFRERLPVHVNTRSPSPASPINVSICAPSRRARRVISARPRVISAATLLEPNPNPAVIPAAIAITFFTELGGSVKNVMAIAAGMTAGLGFGSNSVAALITRGLAEITRLARREGAQMETLMGLAGLGDLVLTCTGSLSRNRFVGEELGKGRTLQEITAELTEVAEGINTARAVKKLADRAGLEMPITNEVNAVLHDGKPARDAVAELMNRPLREEIH